MRAGRVFWRCGPWVAATSVAVVGWWRHVVRAPFAAPGAGSDLVTQYQHLHHWLAERVLAGELPRWNPQQLAGIPAIATLQGALYYPGHVLDVVLPTPSALSAGILLHLAIAAIGTMMAASRLGCTPVASLVAAALVVLRGQFVASLGFTSAFEAMAWLPFGLAGAIDLSRDRRGRGMLVCATATAASLLAGNTQSTVYAVYAWAGLLVAGLIHARHGLRGWSERIGCFAGALGLGALVAAAQLLPTLELTTEASRGTHGLGVEAMFPFGWAMTLPNVLVGAPYWHDSRAIGPTALVLAVVGLASRRWWVVGWAGITAVAALGLSFGPISPVFAVVRHLPALAWFRPKELALPVVHVAVALVAGLGADVVARSRAGVRGVAVVALMAIGAAELLATPVAPLAYHFDEHDDVDAGFYAPTFIEARAIAGHDRVWFAGGSLLATFTTKLASRHALRAIDDYEPFALRRQAEYAAYLADGVPEIRHFPWMWNGIIRPGEDRRQTATRRRLLDALALRVVLVPPGDPERLTTTFLAPAGFSRRDRSPQNVEIWENPSALPRAFVVYRVLPAPPRDELLATLAASTFDPMVQSYVEDGPALAPSFGGPSRGAPATIVVDDDDTVVVDAMLEAPGLLVLADTAYPGWRATVDDRPAAIYVTNHLFRGVAVPAGPHRVRFEYRPWSISVGLVLSALGVLLLLALAWVDRRALRLGIAT